MEALQACSYPYALAWAREQGEDITVEEIQRAARGSLNQLITQMERTQFFLIHDHQNLDPQQEIKDWETARALVKARIGEHEYNYFTVPSAYGYVSTEILHHSQLALAFWGKM